MPVVLECMQKWFLSPSPHTHHDVLYVYVYVVRDPGCTGSAYWCLRTWTDGFSRDGHPEVNAGIYPVPVFWYLYVFFGTLHSQLSHSVSLILYSELSLEKEVPHFLDLVFQLVVYRVQYFFRTNIPVTRFLINYQSLWRRSNVFALSEFSSQRARHYVQSRYTSEKQSQHRFQHWNEIRSGWHTIACKEIKYVNKSCFLEIITNSKKQKRLTTV